MDASEGGLFGVPEPETDIETTLNQFSLAGFSQSEAIVRGSLSSSCIYCIPELFNLTQGLTVCGHTLGSVHHGGFPQVGW